MIFTDTRSASVGRAEHSVVSSCVAQKTNFPKMLFAFFSLYAKKESCQSNNIGKCGLGASFVYLSGQWFLDLSLVNQASL